MHPVDDDPMMASAIGRCSNNWTHAEATLAWIFASLTQTDHTIAVTVFSFFKSTNTQSAVLKKLAKISPFMTQDLRGRLTRALKTYAALAEGRNQLLHNPIGRSITDQIYIMLRTPVPSTGGIPYEAKPISSSEIDGLSAKIRAFVLELVDLQKEIMKAQHPGNSLFGGLFPRD
ncbi:hypothetical protein ACVWWG_006800 [Bradyrhizobium sp. LB7.2]|jgi:hypothetical protein|uniref:hypothetical protein n=1 Tax=Bradyrhizobium sp. LB14.3 TaxID=3156328 RepID=UPI0033979DB8